MDENLTLTAPDAGWVAKEYNAVTNLLERDHDIAKAVERLQDDSIKHEGKDFNDLASRLHNRAINDKTKLSLPHVEITGTDFPSLVDVNVVDKDKKTFVAQLDLKNQK
jgi:hypothetical protein